ncbi:hypothetical protein [Alloyangia pacifica]|uniref:Uncharacterized protein n=1 Tax=Alloyangia pacifica TaxID=311180 RepID=A0A1I6QYH3_9RHOB|nr:hypothetical protein [Alloyangia pacifica]SDG05233.1 hypothetical protein SAMN04488245_101488 [Alloyangia pacifica]SFS57452.1 hypothetical protein SAMN04488050_102489 [Alloyangia pacifica]
MADSLCPLSPPPAGHNRGPALEPPSLLAVERWRRAKAARKAPSGVALRMQLRRAAELGMPPRDYLALRAFCGTDIRAVAFMPDALRLRFARSLQMPEPRRARLRAMRDVYLLGFAPPDEPPESFRQELSDLTGCRFAHCAPCSKTPIAWSEARAGARALLDPLRLPGASVLLVGDGEIATQLYGAARLGGLMSPEEFFGPDLR